MGGLSFWRALHDNGWETCVRSNADGTFSAWAENESTIGPELRVQTAEGARAAALTSLREQTAHDDCSDRCLGWRVKVYTNVVASEMDESGRPDVRKAR